MSKSSLRRRKRRRAYLSWLARKNPKKFHFEWGKRLESWSREADQRGGRLIDDEGKLVPPIFDLVDQALEELTGCGQKALDLEEVDTKEVMTNACCQAVAKAIDRRLYRLSNVQSNYVRMALGD